MKHKLAFSLFGVLLCLMLTKTAYPSVVSAQILIVRNNGEIDYKVLSFSDEIKPEIPKSSNFDVKQSPAVSTAEKPTIALTRNGESVNVLVDEYGSKKEFLINKSTDVILELEERPETSKLEIGYKDGFFTLIQNNFTAYTNFAIKIDAVNARLTVSTERGERIVSIMPNSAIQYLVKSKVINKVSENRLELIEKDSELVYQVSGERLLNIFDLYKYPIEVNSFVSASTGEIVLVEAPVWLKVINNFFS